MKTTFVVTLCILLLLVSACSQKVNDPADVQAVKKAFDDYIKAVNAGDVDGVAALWTEKAIFAENHIPVTVGKGAIRSLQAGINSQFSTDFSGAVEDVRVVSDLAVARGTWNMKLTPKAQGVAPISDSGSWVASAARQNDGSWKWDWCAPNSNQPLPGSTASGEDEQALYQIEKEWGEAATKKDIAALDKMLAPEFQANYPSGIGSKKQFLANLKNSTSKVESAVTSEMRAMVFGERAIVNGVVTEKSSMAGKDTSGQYRYTDVFIKRDGRWQCVTGYANKVDSPAPVTR